MGRNVVRKLFKQKNFIKNNDLDYLFGGREGIAPRKDDPRERLRGYRGGNAGAVGVDAPFLEGSRFPHDYARSRGGFGIMAVLAHLRERGVYSRNSSN